MDFSIVLLVVALLNLSAAVTDEIDSSTTANVSLVSFDDFNAGRGRKDGRKQLTTRARWSSFSELSLPPFDKFDAGTLCRSDSERVIAEALSLNVPALRILDSSAKFPSGVLNGNLNQYGDFDQCIRSSVRLDDRKSVRGKYCLATIGITFKNQNASDIDRLIHSHRMFTNVLSDAGHRIPKLETFNWAMCMPDSCTNSDLQRGLQKQLSQVTSAVEVNVFVDEKLCFKEGTKHFGTVNLLALLFFAAVIAVAVAATFADDANATQSTLIQYVTCFSLKKNLAILTNTETSRDDIPVLHGARFLSAISLLLSHKQMALMFNPIINRTEMAESLAKPWSMIGRSAILYTDNFILISGLLASYSMIKDLDERGRINFRERLVTRFIRFTPNLFALIIFCTFLMEHTGSGPQWGLVVEQYADLCKTNMWKNFLYIHNYFGFENMVITCLTHTHQLGIDMQLFVATPVLVYAVWKRPRQGLLLLLGLAAASTVLRYHVTLKERISTLIYFGISVNRLWRTASLSYILPTHRLTVYIVGLVLGYYLRRKGLRFRLAYGYKLAGWVTTVSCALLAMFGPYEASRKNYVYDASDAAVYNAFSPILWTVFFVWSVIACENGWGGWFYSFLSWKYFAVFTRLSYAIYLTQFPVFFYSVGTQRSPTYYRGFHSMLDLPEFIAILVLSIVLTLLFDLPFQNLRKMYLKKSRSDAESESSDDHPGRCIDEEFKERRRSKNHGD